MLNQIRSSIRTIAAKIMLALLVLSFAVWGIEDMIRSAGGAGALATVGGREVSRVAFYRTYQKEMEKLQAAMGKSFKPEMAKMLGLPQRVLQQSVVSELLAREAEELGLLPDDTIIAREIRNMNAFKDETGKFSKELYESTLARNGMTEKSLVMDLRREMGVRLLLASLAEGEPVSKIMATTLSQASREQRSISIVTVSATGEQAAPVADEATLEAFYQQQRGTFERPETRRVSYITFAPADLAKNVTVEESEIEALYKERASAFGEGAAPLDSMRAQLKEEIRAQKGQGAVGATVTVLQDRLAGGETLKEIAKSMNFTYGETGDFDAEGNSPKGGKAELPPYKDFIATAFSLEQGRESTPHATGDNGRYYLLLVEKINDAAAPPLAEIKDKVHAAWVKQSRQETLLKEAEKLADALKKDPKTPAAFNAYGTLTRQNRNENLPAALVSDIFKLNVGETSRAYLSANGSYLIARVDSITQAAPITYESLLKDAQMVTGLEQLKQTMREEVLEAYLNYLREKYPVKIYEKSLAALTHTEQ